MGWRSGVGRMGLALVVSLTASGCGGCRGKSTERPSDTVVQEQAKKRLEESPDLVAKICGIDVKKLADATISVVSSSGDKYKVRISGRPDLPDAGDDDDDDDDDAGAEAGTHEAGTRADGGIVTSKTKALICAGLFTLEVKRVLDNDGKMTAWGSGALALESIETGKHTDSDPSPRPRTRHHRRRHHH